MTVEQTLSYYITKSSQLDTSKFERKMRIAILASFTLNGLEDTLRVKCAEKKIAASIFSAGYNQYNQEIFNKGSSLYDHFPDVTFLILDTRSILGNFFYHPYSITSLERKTFVESKAKELENLVKTFIKNSKSKLVITNLTLPTYSSHGIFENKNEYGLQEMVIDLNKRLVDFSKKESALYVYDFNNFVMKHGDSNVFDHRQYFFGDIKISLEYIPLFAEELMGYVKAILGLNKKCIVLDLDNTLWGGVVGEDGFNGIKLGPTPPGNAYVEFQKHLLSLNQRGIILAINSKNNLDDAIEVIKNHPYMILREENFASVRINWNDKVNNIKEIAEELNIGLDSVVYIDDDPVNREYMNINLPEVLTVNLPQDPALYTPTLQNLNDFNVLKITDEDLKRSAMYNQERKRKDLEKTVTNLDDFLKHLDMKLKIKKADQFTIPRISQLTLKTNQFNLTTKRYQEEEIKKFVQDENTLVRCVEVEDKFGDNGIAGVFIIKKENPKEWGIDTFLLSCRVMGREVEKGILSHIINMAKENGVEKIKAQFIPTKKNKPIETFLPNCGFKQEGDFWVYPVSTLFRIPEYLKVSAE
ncbi:MAG TPA: HAD-IIIC family phosphatase [Candidatus Nitrosotalea sp.]|nr:HAD-IIIC family phosphatase [Candidatus Nitrosotalea sp.]